MSERMLRFSDINWAEVITSSESPVTFCLRKDIPAYFRVKRDHQRVRYDYRRWTGARRNLIFQQIDKFSVRGPSWKIDRRILLMEYVVDDFHDELLFLRLNNSSSAEIAVSGYSSVKSFSRDGFAIPRPFRVVGHTIRGREVRMHEDIKSPTLVKVEFDRAFLIDKEKWESAPLIPPEGTCHAPEAFAISDEEIGESDLWFASADIDALKREALEGRELASYPFAHKERMPGIYWMFQAAYAHRHLKMESEDEKKVVAKWLSDEAPKSTYRYKSIRTATKFTWPKLDRSKGGGGRGEFNLEDLDGWADRAHYELSFVGKEPSFEGLSFILAIADWWEALIERAPSETKLSLAKKLDENKFGGLEVGDLVYLISGSQLTDEDVASFYAYKVGRTVTDEEVESLIEDHKLRRIVETKPKKAGRKKAGS